MAIVTIGVSAATSQITFLDDLWASLLSAEVDAEFVVDIFVNTSNEQADAYAKYFRSIVGDREIAVRTRAEGCLGESRNWIVEQARTEFLLFVDGDDFFDQEKLAYLLRRLKSALDNPPDLFVFGGKAEHEGQRHTWVRHHLPRQKLSGSDEIKRWFNDEGWRLTSACLKVYSTAFLRSVRVRFPAKYYYEDTPYWFDLARECRVIDVINSEVYVYRRHNHGQITTDLTARLFDVFEILDLMNARIVADPAKTFEAAFHAFVLHHLLWSIRMLERSDLASGEKLRFRNLTYRYALTSKNFLVAINSYHLNAEDDRVLLPPRSEGNFGAGLRGAAGARLRTAFKLRTAVRRWIGERAHGRFSARL